MCCSPQYMQHESALSWHQKQGNPIASCCLPVAHEKPGMRKMKAMSRPDIHRIERFRTQIVLWTDIASMGRITQANRHSRWSGCS